jgi:2'-5' RNA ligase
MVSGKLLKGIKMSKLLRLFIAVNISMELKGQISGILSKCKNIEPSIKWVNQKDIHITLKFLGETPEEKLKNIELALKDICSLHSVFTLNMKRVGVFPNVKRPRIIWLGIDKGSKCLTDINKDLEEILFKAGFPKENKEFKSHITLGRVKDFSNVKDMDNVLKSISQEELNSLIEQKIDKISLMKSTLYSTGPVYEVLSEYSLERV